MGAIHLKFMIVERKKSFFLLFFFDIKYSMWNEWELSLRILRGQQFAHQNESQKKNEKIERIKKVFFSLLFQSAISVLTEQLFCSLPKKKNERKWRKKSMNERKLFLLFVSELRKFLTQPTSHLSFLPHPPPLHPLNTK